jgi:hypothetical protein
MENTGNELLDVSSKQYSAILDEIVKEKVTISSRVEASFHFIKYHDCSCREDDFLKVLRKYIFTYCFPRTRYKHQDAFDIGDLTWEARDKFFNPSDPSNSGELGEIALYFLLEGYLKAPQIVSKMSLKTTDGENFKGSDGIHFGRYNDKNCIFYCESKLDKERCDALRYCIESVIDFHNTKKDFEVSLIRNNIDVDNQELRKAIIDYLDPASEKTEDWIEINACFVGYNWDKFTIIEQQTDNTLLQEELKNMYKEDIEHIKNYLQKRIDPSKTKQRFYFFIIPFKDVERLRVKFMELLYGQHK